MSDIVEQCRSEWQRLRVPDLAADEMAAELAADLNEAAADGITAEEVLGEGAADPRSLALAWATERGFVHPSFLARLGNRRTLLIASALAAAGIAAGFGINEAVRSSPTRSPTTVPYLVHLTEPAARAAGLTVRVRHLSSKQPAGIVLTQRPFAGQHLSPGATITITVAD
jgi:hypothetical protein